MNELGLFFFIISGITPLTNCTKWLVDNADFDNPNNWFNDHLPCAREEVVFPEEYLGLLPVPKNVAVKGFTLPRNGALLLSQDSTIELNGNSQKRLCQNKKAYIRPPKVYKWFDPKSWLTVPQKSSNNKAVPALEKVPCNNESVVIPSKAPLALDLSNVPYLRMGQLSFAGSLLSKDYVRQLLRTDLGQLLFHNQAGVMVEYYHNDICGCHRDFNHLLEPICNTVIKSCDKPHCHTSITPLGSCCSLCGSSLSFSVDNCDNARLHVMQSVIEDGIRERKLQNDLDYHVNYFNAKDYGIFLQAVIVDRKDYSEKSVQLMKHLNSSVNWLKKLNLKSLAMSKMQYSGRPYNPELSFTSFILITLCILFVSLVALIMFAHYVPNHRLLLYVPQWLYDPRLWLNYDWRSLLHRSNFAFARFENNRFSTRTTITNIGGGGAAPLVMTYDAENDRLTERSFDNPMFNEQPCSSKVAAQQLETKDKLDLIMDSVVVGNDVVNDDGEEQELTAINLNNLSSDSDNDEAETKE